MRQNTWQGTDSHTVSFKALFYHCLGWERVLHVPTLCMLIGFFSSLTPKKKGDGVRRLQGRDDLWETDFLPAETVHTNGASVYNPANLSGFLHPSRHPSDRVHLPPSEAVTAGKGVLKNKIPCWRDKEPITGCRTKSQWFLSFVSLWMVILENANAFFFSPLFKVNV